MPGSDPHTAKSPSLHSENKHTLEEIKSMADILYHDLDLEERKERNRREVLKFM